MNGNLKNKLVSVSASDCCVPVKSDEKNWFSTAQVMYDMGAEDSNGNWVWGSNWALGDDFLIPIVRLTDEQVQKGITDDMHCDSSMVEKYIGSTLPANILTFIANGSGGAAYVDSFKVENVNEWADYANQKITIIGEIKHNPETNDCTLGNSLVIRVKTKKFQDQNLKCRIKIGIYNSLNLKQKSYIVLKK
jgi:hypothetical protein